LEAALPSCTKQFVNDFTSAVDGPFRQVSFSSPLASLQVVPSVLQQKHFVVPVTRPPFSGSLVEVHSAMLYEVSAFCRLQMSPRAARSSVGTPQLHDLVEALLPSLGLQISNSDTALFRQTRPDSARLHLCLELQHAQKPLFTAPSWFVHAGNFFSEYRL
jgi:hypothetical protein